MATISCPDGDCPKDDFETEAGMKRHHARVHDESLVRTEVECANCGELVEKYRPEQNENCFCSYECRGEYQSNDNEWREAVREGLPDGHSAGKANAQYGKTGSEHPRSGVDCLDEEARKRMGPGRGPDHFAWTGCEGIGFGPRWSARREEVLSRDGRQCVVCGSDEMVDVHHVTPRWFVYYHPFFRWDDVNNTSNLVSLCREHHAKADAYGNFWEQYPEEVSGLGGNFKL